MKILFVCTGNACRSVLAEGYFKKLLREYSIDWIEVKSAGTAAMQTYQVPGVIFSLLNDEKVDMSNHTPTPINKLIVDNSNLILVMDNTHKEEILRRYPDSKSKVFLIKEYAGKEENWEIFDPIGQSEEVYIERAIEIKNTVEKVFNKIVRKHQ